MSKQSKRRPLELVICGGILLALIAPAQAAEPTSCDFQFDATAMAEHGSIAAGSTVLGEVQFDLGADETKGDTRNFESSGVITVSLEGAGSITGEIWNVHVTRSPAVGDYINVVARNTSGDLGGIEANFDPMLLSLWGPRNMMSDFEMPITSEGWNAYQTRRVFQFAGVGQTTVSFDVGSLRGGCE